jgi:ribosomal protein L37AE/L43A
LRVLKFKCLNPDAAARAEAVVERTGTKRTEGTEMGFEAIPEDKQESYPCPECEAGAVTQCDVTGDWTCDSCDWWVATTDTSEDQDDG